jgi:hypothetical protein
LCIGANVALFSVVNNVLLRPLPMPESGRIAIIGNSYPKEGAANLRAVGVPDYFDRLRETTAFEEQALYNNASVNVDQNGTATRVRAMNVTPSFFRVLGVQAHLGRTFTDVEGEQGNQLKVVLSYGLWQSAFACRRSAFTVCWLTSSRSGRAKSASGSRSAAAAGGSSI